MANTRGKSLPEEGERRLAESLRAAPLRPFKVNLSDSQSRANVWLTSQACRRHPGIGIDEGDDAWDFMYDLGGPVSVQRSRINRV